MYEHTGPIGPMRIPAAVIGTDGRVKFVLATLVGLDTEEDRRTFEVALLFQRRKIEKAWLEVVRVNWARRLQEVVVRRREWDESVHNPLIDRVSKGKCCNGWWMNLLGTEVPTWLVDPNPAWGTDTGLHSNSPADGTRRRGNT